LFTETTGLKGKPRLPQISTKLTYYKTYLDFPMMQYYSGHNYYCDDDKNKTTNRFHAK